MPKFYLDTVLVSHKVKRDQLAEAAAFEKFEDAHAAGSVQAVTSDATAREIERLPAGYRDMLMPAFDALDKVPMIEAQVTRGYCAQTDPYGGFTSWAIVDDHPTWSALRHIGLDSADAQQIMVAIETGCDVFFTCDRRTILNPYRAAIEKMFPMIKLRAPPEWASSASAATIP
jgi:hypothetical protein